MWIAGQFDPSKISCSAVAKEEAERLAEKSQMAIDSSFFAKDETFIAFLNARSLRKHQKDISLDPEIMMSDILGIAETNLYENEDIDLEGFEGSFVNAGKGKGVAAFTKIDVSNKKKICQPSFTAISLELENLKIIFAYLSSKINMEELNVHLRPMLQEKKKPTIIMGDMNFHFSEKYNSRKSYLEEFGFHQVVERVTHDDGHILDQIYVTSNLQHLLKQNVFLKPLYFSDHDALCIRLPKL